MHTLTQQLLQQVSLHGHKAVTLLTAVKRHAVDQRLAIVEADLQAFPVGLFLFALGHDVHHPASLVAARAAHALDVADGGGIRVKADNQIHLQGMVLV